MRHSIFLGAAVLSALSFSPSFTLAQVVGFDVFVTPTNNEVVAAGSNFDIIWAPSSPVGPVTIRLMQGSSELNQEFGPTIASGIDSTLGKYTWAIPSSYGDYASYGFKLQLDSDNTIFQYSYPFVIGKSGVQSLASASQVPAPTSTAVVTRTSVVAVTQSNPPSNPKATTTPQGAASSSNTRNTPNNPSTSGSPTSGTNSFSTTSPANPTSPISSAGGGLQTGITSSPSSSSTSSPTTASTADSGLAVGAKAGIAIGAIAGTCIIVLLAYIAILMRRKTAGKDAVIVEDDKPLERVSELGPGEMFSEMDATRDPQELEDGHGAKYGYDGRRKRKSKRLESIAELP